jgi:translation initiation factor eIF-2B subunit delta
MMAHHNHIPVLVCCETHKFYERVQLDAICNNELEDADSLLRG